MRYVVIYSFLPKDKESLFFHLGDPLLKHLEDPLWKTSGLQAIFLSVCTYNNMPEIGRGGRHAKGQMWLTPLAHHDPLLAPRAAF